MSNDRVKELQDISNEFLRRLGEDEDEYESKKSPLKTEINSEIKSNSKYNKLNLPNFSISRLYKRESEKSPYHINIIDELHANENAHTRILIKLLQFSKSGCFCKNCSILSSFSSGNTEQVI